MAAAKDPGKGHFYVSLIKSAFRILAGAALISGAVWAPIMFVHAGILFIVAEVLGIVEEIV